MPKAPTKKTPAKKAPAKTPAAKAPAAKAPPKKEATSVDDAVQEALEFIDEHDYASSDVSRSESLDFYQQIADACSERAETIQSELDKEEGGGEEG